MVSTMARVAISSNWLSNDTPGKELCHFGKNMHLTIYTYKVANSSSGDYVQSLIRSFNRMPQLRRCLSSPDLGVNLQPEVH